jgi:hypothetical protein
MESQVLANGWMREATSAQQERSAERAAAYDHLRCSDLQSARCSRARPICGDCAAYDATLNNQALRLAVWDEMRTSF